MEVWVDLKIVQWAYAHCQQFTIPSAYLDGKNGAGLEKAFRFKMVIGKYGCVVRHRPDRRLTGRTEDKQILLDFEDEQAHIWFLLRWS